MTALPAPDPAVVRAPARPRQHLHAVHVAADSVPDVPYEEESRWRRPTAAEIAVLLAALATLALVYVALSAPGA